MAAADGPVAERRASDAVVPARRSRPPVIAARLRRTVVFIGLCLVSITTVYPLIFMALNSMRTAQAYEVSPYGLPTHYNLDNFRALFNQVPFLASVLHSIIVVVPAVLLATLFSALAAFVFTKVPIKLGNALFWLMLMIMFMPGIVVLIPLYVDPGLHGDQHPLRHLPAPVDLPGHPGLSGRGRPRRRRALAQDLLPGDSADGAGRRHDRRDFDLP
jgi:hypothetical protein